MKLVIDNKPTNDFADKVSKLVAEAKRNTQWRKQFMDWEIEKAYSFDAGKEEGLKEKAIDAALELLKKKVSPEIIAKCEKLPLETVLELKEQLEIHA